jgi:ribosomal protein S18 acetylase RimI-like enzyme
MSESLGSGRAVASDLAGGRSASLTYRTPRRSDRRGVKEVVEATAVFRPDEIEVALEVFDGYCAAPGVDYHAIAAYAEDRLAGFAFFGPAPCTVNTWDLYWLAVHPAFQGHGAGRGLVERVERRMREGNARLSVIETSSREDYRTTRGFYVRSGYREVARVPGFYAEADDRVTYIKRL